LYCYTAAAAAAAMAAAAAEEGTAGVAMQGGDGAGAAGGEGGEEGVPIERRATHPPGTSGESGGTTHNLQHFTNGSLKSSMSFSSYSGLLQGASVSSNLGSNHPAPGSSYHRAASAGTIPADVITGFNVRGGGGGGEDN
jgi:hypothetical protein